MAFNLCRVVAPKIFFTFVESHLVMEVIASALIASFTLTTRSFDVTISWTTERQIKCVS